MQWGKWGVLIRFSKLEAAALGSGDPIMALTIAIPERDLEGEDDWKRTRWMLVTFIPPMDTVGMLVL